MRRKLPSPIGTMLVGALLCLAGVFLGASVAQAAFVWLTVAVAALAIALMI